MYHPHKHGVLDHTFLSVFLRVGGKSGRAEGPTLILVVQTIGFPVMRRMNHLSELEEYGHQVLTFCHKTKHIQICSLRVPHYL